MVPVQCIAQRGIGYLENILKVCLFLRESLIVWVFLGRINQNNSSYCQVTICLLNWSSLCRIKTQTQNIQSGSLGVVLNQDPATVGLVVMPEFTYQKGQLWRSEFSAIEALAQHGLNVDRIVALQFLGRKDQRDSRPLVYRARAAHGQSFPEAEWVFKQSSLIREGRTPPVNQVAGADMVLIEDVDSSALPTGVDMETVSGAKKFEQLGTELYAAILDQAMEGMSMDGRCGIVVMDMNVLTGDAFGAWLEKRKSWTAPTLHPTVPDPLMKDCNF